MAKNIVATSIDVSRETVEACREYERALLKWQKKINLISPDSEQFSWQRHIVDSLQLTPLVPPNARKMLDVGSGGGLPAIPLAIASKFLDLPALSITLVESDSRKSVFLKHMIRQHRLAAEVKNQRIESLDLEKFDLIACRAFRSLTDIFTLLSRFSHTNSTWILPKGRNWKAEIEVAKLKWHFEFTTQQSQTDSDARILIVTQVTKK